MCGPDPPENRMEELSDMLMGEDMSGISEEFWDEEGNRKEFSAAHAAKEMETSPQMVGKLLACYDRMWKRVIRRGKVFYTPINHEYAIL